MDRLVKPDVKEIELSFKKSEKCKANFKLTNMMHTMPVAVSLTTSNSSVFSFSQSYSIIPPLSSSSYTILSKPSNHPPISTPPDTITVRSVILPIGKANTEDLRRLFLKPGRHIFKDASLLISYIGPHVAEFLMSHHCQNPELSFLFNKAISNCKKSQLTELMFPAISSGKLTLVSALIDAGVDINVKDSLGKSMISLAIQTGKIDIVKRLIDSNCKINPSVDHVFHYAAAMNRIDLIDILHKNFPEISVNSTDSDGRNPIHITTIHGHIETIVFLLSIGGKPEAIDRKKWTPLHNAAAEGNLAAVNILLDNSNIKYAINSDRKTAFDIASENGNLNLFDSLQLGDELQRTARNGDVLGLKSCLTMGAKVNGRDQNGWTALHRAALKGRIECVKVLIENGAELNAVDDDYGLTPLRCAIDAGNEEVAVLLIDNGAKGDKFRVLKGD